MKVGWLMAAPGYIGGAELTQYEFRAAAPKGVEIVDCPPGEVEPGLDRYVVHNCVPYTMEDIEALGSAPVVKYVHDLWPAGDSDVRDWFLQRVNLVFCSTLHREHFTRRFHPVRKTAVVPPALDLQSFKPSRQAKRNGNRSGACSVAGWRNPGKGGQALLEWANENEPVDVYGDGAFLPHGENLNLKGPLAPIEVGQTLWMYQTFVFLPFDVEPFCRSVVEAWMAGCRVVTNRLVGALEWLRQPQKLETAGKDFWKVVLDA